MELQFCPLFSGSSGNSVYVGYGDTHILIDAGVSCKKLMLELDSIGVSPDSISSILITHEHSDHISGAGVFTRKNSCDIYATNETWTAMKGSLGKVENAHIREIVPDEDFFIGQLNIRPFSTPHDAAGSVGYVITAPDGASLALATDMGYASRNCVSAITGANAVLLEFNYDEDMLMFGPYPYDLKRRIRSNKGHLSNADGADLACKLVKNGTKCLVLSHLSKENNMPEIAMQVCKTRLEEENLSANVTVARRDGNSGMFTVKGEWE